MPTVTACSHCQAKYSVPESAVGKRATCAKCKQTFVLAAATATTGVGKVAAKAANTPVVKTQAEGKSNASAKPLESSKPQAVGVVRERLTEAELMAAFGPKESRDARGRTLSLRIAFPRRRRHLAQP